MKNAASRLLAVLFIANETLNLSGGMFVLHKGTCERVSASYSPRRDKCVVDWVSGEVGTWHQLVRGCRLDAAALLRHFSRDITDIICFLHSESHMLCQQLPLGLGAERLFH